MELSIISELKVFINDGNCEGFIDLWKELNNDTEFEKPVAWDYVFQKVYIHACLKKRVDISEYLEKEVYVNMEELYKIALRTVFPYGKSLLRKR